MTQTPPNTLAALLEKAQQIIDGYGHFKKNDPDVWQIVYGFRNLATAHLATLREDGGGAVVKDTVWISTKETLPSVMEGHRWPCVFNHKRDGAKKYVSDDIVAEKDRDIASLTGQLGIARAALKNPSDAGGRPDVDLNVQDLTHPQPIDADEPFGVDQNFLRMLVDVVWQHCYENKSVPATYVADALIEEAFKHCGYNHPSLSTPPQADTPIKGAGEEKEEWQTLSTLDLLKAMVKQIMESNLVLAPYAQAGKQYCPTCYCDPNVGHFSHCALVASQKHLATTPAPIDAEVREAVDTVAAFPTFSPSEQMARLPRFTQALETIRAALKNGG